jgi:hypothetical protein
MKRTRKQLKTSAYHEAGHAVIGRVLALPCGGATIKPDYKNCNAGTAITADLYTCQEQWEKRGKVVSADGLTPADGIEARIMIHMAGAEAEIELLGSQAVGDSDDKLKIGLIVDEFYRVDFWEKLEPRLREMTRMLVRRHRECIERVAKTLLVRTTLSAKALDKLIGTFILAMHQQ